MVVQIAIDTREPVLQSLLNSYYDKYSQNPDATGITIQTEQLYIGDVVIRIINKAKDTGTTGETRETDKNEEVVSILFERKTCADLAASVKDGRYRDQKTRLLSNGTLARRVFYMLEGVPEMKEILSTKVPIHGVKPSVLSGMMIHSMLRDGIHVICIKNTSETAAWIWSIALKCLANPEKISGGHDQTTIALQSNDNMSSINYLQNVKVKKIDNITPTSCYLMQLCQIPNISITTANGIVAKYPTMLVLLNALAELTDNEHRVKCLCELPMIGKKKAQTILMYLLPGYE